MSRWLVFLFVMGWGIFQLMGSSLHKSIFIANYPSEKDRNALIKQIQILEEWFDRLLGVTQRKGNILIFPEPLGKEMITEENYVLIIPPDAVLTIPNQHELAYALLLQRLDVPFPKIKRMYLEWFAAGLSILLEEQSKSYSPQQQLLISKRLFLEGKIPDLSCLILHPVSPFYQLGYSVYRDLCGGTVLVLGRKSRALRSFLNELAVSTEGTFVPQLVDRLMEQLEVPKDHRRDWWLQELKKSVWPIYTIWPMEYTRRTLVNLLSKVEPETGISIAYYVVHTQKIPKIPYFEEIFRDFAKQMIYIHPVYRETAQYLLDVFYHPESIKKQRSFSYLWNFAENQRAKLEYVCQQYNSHSPSLSQSHLPIHQSYLFPPLFHQQTRQLLQWIDAIFYQPF